MTNYDRWREYTRKLTSPDTWIDAGFFYMISAALQRRVWLYGEGEDGGELFPNQYVCLVGPPGLGKGLVIGPVARLLRHHKYEKGQLIKTSAGTEKPSLFAVGADAITFEELIEDVADNTRRVPKPNGEIYVHSSYAFLLEELDSLFKRKTQDVINFLKNAYDCKPYDYKTKHQGKQLLRALCVSLLAGTQPDFLFEARKSGIFGQGFASRTLFLFESKERFSAFHITQLDEDQKEYEKELLSWLKRLAMLYGEVKYDQPTYNFLESWNRDVLTIEKLKANPKMSEYFARKKVIMLKLAMAMHFGDSLAMTIPCETFIRAINWLKLIEAKLESGLGCTGRNELHAYQKRIHEFILSRGTASERDIKIAFTMDLSIAEINEALEALEIQGAIKSRQEKGIRLYYT